MAEEERLWSQRHVHETNTVSYGQFGTPTYHESSQDWEFLRHDRVVEIIKEDAAEQEGHQGLLKILTSPEAVIEPARIDGPDLNAQVNDPRLNSFPEIATAFPLTKAIDREKFAGAPASHRGDRVAFGSALWLSADGVGSGNLVVPVAAYATGSGAATFCLACAGQEHLPGLIEDDPTLRIRVPSLLGDPQSFWYGTEPILQLCFSRRNADGHGDTFLLVRRASQTSIFEPLLYRGSYSSDRGRSSLDPNHLVTLHASVTGGHSHVDSAFHPSDHRKLAIVDAEGNWSIWKIRGRRSRTARVLYQARLRSSGKIFSWKHRKRPAGVGLFFDGWHKVVWASSDGHEVDRLLVCNRQTVKLFSLAGQEMRSIDPRLDIGKASYILDVCPGPKINICLILTSTRLLVFDIEQEEWKDPARSKGPALICAYQHFLNPTALSLRTVDILYGDESLIILYPTGSDSLSIRKMTLSEVDGKTSMTISDACSLTLPIRSWRVRPAAVTLTSSEIAHSAAILIHQQELLRLIIQNEDLSVYSLWAAARVSSASSKLAPPRQLLRLPPNRSLQRKSGLRVDDAESEDDLDDFVVSDTDEDDDELDGHNAGPHPSPMIALGKFKAMKHVDEFHTAIQEQSAKRVPQSATSTPEVSERLEARLHDLKLSRDVQPGCLSLCELVKDRARVGDVEAESNELQQAVSNLSQNSTDWTTSLCHGQSDKTLMNLYNIMFDTFVDSLPSGVPDRSRVQKERQFRGIALEQYLSSYAVRPLPKETRVSLNQTSATSEISQTVFSDPLQHNSAESQRFQSVSASQPLPRAESPAPSPSAMHSPLLDSLSRLRSYTKLNNDLDEPPSESPDTLNHFSSVLSHLPQSCDENPDDYDYQGVVIANAAEKADAREQDAQTGSRAQRKAARLTKARERAEQLMHSRRTDKEPGNSSRGANFNGHRSQDVNAGVLPIRSSGERHAGLAWRDDIARTQHGYHLSDGHVPPESSSQAAMRDNVTLTQPERGIFANRADGKGHDKVKKKKKRIAGF